MKFLELSLAVVDWTQYWLTVSGVALGAVLGWVGSWTSVGRQHRLTVEKEQLAEREFVRRVEAAILAEVNNLIHHYNDGIGSQIREKNSSEMLYFFFPVTQNLFSIFEGNCCHLGKLEPAKAKAIASFYTSAKVLVEMLVANNVAISEYERWCAIPHSSDEKQNKYNRDRFERAKKMLIDQLGALKAMDAQFTASGRTLVEKLEAKSD